MSPLLRAASVRFSARLARALLPLAVVTALLVSLAAPATWFLLRRDELKAEAQALAARLARHMQRFVAEEPELWMYNSGKVGERFRILLEGNENVHLEIRDGRGRLAYHSVPEPGGCVWSEVPVQSAGEEVGRVLVGIGSRDLLLTGLLLLVCFSLLGLAFSAAIYLLPTRLMARSEAELDRALGALGEAQADLEETNQALEARVRERTEALQAAHDRLRSLAAETFSAREGERLRISRDLHDQLGQTMTAIRIALETARAGGGEEALDHAVSLSDEAAEHVRRTLRLLAVPPIGDAGLEGAVRELVGRFAPSECKIEVDLEEPAGGLHPALAACAYRVFQEGLTNALKHGNPGRVWLRTRLQGRALLVEIEDDGEGASPETSWGMGLAGMRDRVELLGGELEVDFGASNGVRLTASLPLGTPPSPPQAGG